MTRIILFLLIGLGFALRLFYLLNTHPFFDEYITVLAARQILDYGWPRLPSGLFYEHGLLATYIIAPFTALFIHTPIEEWSAAEWRLMLARWPSVLIGTVTIPLIYRLGKEVLKNDSAEGIALLAAGLFALSPEGMVWGGRARMYALATLLVWVTAGLAYRGAIYPAPARYRWLALLILMAALLTQFGVLMIIPPLLIGMIVVGWRSWKNHPTEVSRRIWFLQPTILGEGIGLAIVIGLALWIKRLGRPLGKAALGDSQTGNWLAELISTITYQTTFRLTWADTQTFLARQFGVPHHLWLSLAAIIGVLFLLYRKKLRFRSFSFFVGIVFGLLILEMLTLLEPFRRNNPRYMVMYLPLFYLIVAVALFELRRLIKNQEGLVILVLILFVGIGWPDFRVALKTPEPAYEEALAYIQAEWQPGDRLLTMNTPAAELYLRHGDGFTVQKDASQFLLNLETNPVDRWAGVPWVGTATEFYQQIEAAERLWFVIDPIRQPVYFRADWLAVVYTQLEPVWQGDNVLVYRTRSERIPMSTQPEVTFDALLGDSITLKGYALQRSANSEQLYITLFWQPITDLKVDYTVFLHLRDEQGATVAQHDSRPLEGTYPTHHWQPGEMVLDPIVFSLPESLPSGRYHLLVGLYRLDTLERLIVHQDSSGENAILLGDVQLP